MPNGHTITPEYVDTDWGAQYALTLRREGSQTVLVRLITASTAVIAAASYLLEKADSPEQLANSWRDPDALDQQGPVDLDVETGNRTVGDRLVETAELLQKA